METNHSRRWLVFLVVAIVPLLMAIAINIPADAGTVSVEVGRTPSVELLPSDAERLDYEVILDTGIEVVGYESSISAIAIVATEPVGRAQAPPVNE